MEISHIFFSVLVNQVLLSNSNFLLIFLTLGKTSQKLDIEPVAKSVSQPLELLMEYSHRITVTPWESTLDATDTWSLLLVPKRITWLRHSLLISRSTEDIRKYQIHNSMTTLPYHVYIKINVICHKTSLNIHSLR